MMQKTANDWSSALMNNYGIPAISLTGGQGMYLTDTEGKRYLDMLAGIAVNALGQAHPDIVEAVSTQIATLGHTSNIFATPHSVEVATSLKQRFADGKDDSARVFFCNSGAEANEAAFKIARLTGRGRVLAAEAGFHGRTMGALALTGQPEKRAPFEPLPGGVDFYPYGDVQKLREIVEEDPDGIAAIFAEPIQGETGVIPAPEGFLAAVRQLCDDYGILMVADEVQTGVGRTGKFFAHEYAGVVPDVVTMAKGLGGGLPMGAVLARGAAAQYLQPGQHGTTFGGNPVVLAAARTVLNTLDERFLQHVREIGAYLRSQLQQLSAVSEVRGTGLMLGVVLESANAKEIVVAGLERGLILNAPSDKVVRLTPPLIIERRHVDECVTILQEILD
ncbi:acetylornithine transaminase [Corynebacterium pseudodiphtheriticum]|uniref:Acetylornithine aminotransferase n=1 Tax=Corynebacterium pseudodiphtheriticum TaxID=37637 RepID=A0AAP4BSR9_9CORY|nr:acetylornithine transaminase [Corynebacterium pseudodiphtheriticum]MCG7252287.1 acetylornithine transaminase [Corynebacterium pseudodiphtheriticum]MDK4229324.1 acetylornithine transaminase [Corynebacterium pseudodiphtheriticum]MDK4305796.1 acetylornithine transaminase [Corynebacterium pseudodiphtheriticum]MDK4307790.1 acetylornithine transaminase [Corynebacterium pseudodiphtheriticum]MDK8709630.1 acetylornithine transaminase [Corynebacterium pseudodiphtheriticum]